MTSSQVLRHLIIHSQTIPVTKFYNFLLNNRSTSVLQAVPSYTTSPASLETILVSTRVLNTTELRFFPIIIHTQITIHHPPRVHPPHLHSHLAYNELLSMNSSLQQGQAVRFIHHSTIQSLW